MHVWMGWRSRHNISVTRHRNKPSTIAVSATKYVKHQTLPSVCGRRVPHGTYLY